MRNTNQPATTTAAPQTSDARYIETKRAITFFQTDEAAGARAFRDVAYSLAFCGHEGAITTIIFKLQAYGLPADHVDFEEVYWSVFAMLIRR